MFIFVFTFMSEIASETEILCLLASLLSWSTYSCACCSTVIWAGISELIRKLGVLTLEQNFKIVASKFYQFFGKKHENYVYKFKSFTKVTFSYNNILKISPELMNITHSRHGDGWKFCEYFLKDNICLMILQLWEEKTYSRFNQSFSLHF